jgi:hypothetical protein
MSAEKVNSSIPTAQVAVTKTLARVPGFVLLQHLCWCYMLRVNNNALIRPEQVFYNPVELPTVAVT